MKRDSLQVGELTVYKACIQWAQAECKRNDRTVTTLTLVFSIEPAYLIYHYTKFSRQIARLIVITETQNILLFYNQLEITKVL